MSSKLGEDIPVGIYRSSDDISNFKMRVRIRKATALTAPVPENGDFFGAQEYELLQLHAGERISCSERTFSWQQKVSKEDNPTSSEAAAAEQTDANIPLFSYITTESPTLDQEKHLWLTIRHPKQESKGTITGGKKNFYSDEIKTFQKPSFFKELVQISSRKNPSHVFGQSMTIAALLDADDSSDAEEVYLCYLTYDTNGVLTIVPDFNRTPYYIRSSKSETYEFIMEHISDSINSVEAEQEKSFLKRVCQHHAETVATIVGGNFEMPPSKVKVCYIIGELVSAEDFEADNLFVRFTFETPKGAIAKDEKSLSGLTNFCRVKKKMGSNGTIAYFASPLNLHLEADEFAELNEVRLLVEVSSIDFWNVCRNEGYGYGVLSTSPGLQSIEIKTWKLLPQTVLGMLQNYFIGGTPYLDDMGYSRIPSSFEGSRLSKYGLKTETSGSVNVKFHTIVQCRLAC